MREPLDVNSSMQADSSTTPKVTCKLGGVPTGLRSLGSGFRV